MVLVYPVCKICLWSVTTFALNMGLATSQCFSLEFEALKGSPVIKTLFLDDITNAV